MNRYARAHVAAAGFTSCLVDESSPLRCRYLGLYVTEVEAAIAYDTEAVAQKGIQAITNFALSTYQHMMSAHGSCVKVQDTESYCNELYYGNAKPFSICMV